MSAPQGYLLDTTVLSSFAPGRPAVSPEFAAWLREREDRLFMPCIGVAEIEQGICKLRRKGATTKAARMSAWLDGLIDQYGDRVLALDTVASRTAGRISDHAKAAGKHPGFADVAIAGLAKAKNLMVLTRNLRHFTPLGIACADPLQELPQ